MPVTGFANRESEFCIGGKNLIGDGEKMPTGLGLEGTLWAGAPTGLGLEGTLWVGEPQPEKGVELIAGAGLI